MPQKVIKMQPTAVTPSAQPHVPTIQELIRDRLIKNADTATASSDTVLAQAQAKYMSNGTVFGADPGSLTMTKRTLTFQAAEHGAAITIPIETIKSAKTAPGSLTIVSDKAYCFRIKGKHGAAQNANGQPMTLAGWATLLKQLQPNVQLSSGAGFGAAIKLGVIAMIFAVLMYFAYVSTTL